MTCAVHVLYEFGLDWRPHGSAYIRLLRPLSHPSLQDELDVTFAKDYHNEPVDVVLLDRLWRPDVSLDLVERLLEQVRRVGARFFYSLDDDFLSLDSRRTPWFTESHRKIASFLLQEADTVLVTTQELQQRFAGLNESTVVLPNALDERLLVGGGLPLLGGQRLVIGFMGTPTHDDDLLMILPALQKVAEMYPERIIFQLIGGVEHAGTWTALKGLPLRVVSPHPSETEYPLFMAWLTSQIHWDIALAPLSDAPFNASKSDIKFLDYCAMGTAGIYSRVPAYANSVRNRETGWVVDNDPSSWYDVLVRLIEAATLRQRLAERAQRYLFSQRVLAKRAVDWLAILK
jgi:glycosyltransferase involved in cell wall biosynthesis